jgi:hypothetical protein
LLLAGKPEKNLRNLIASQENSSLLATAENAQIAVI